MKTVLEFRRSKVQGTPVNHLMILILTWRDLSLKMIHIVRPEKEEEPAENEQEMSTEPSPPGSATFTTCHFLLEHGYLPMFHSKSGQLLNVVQNLVEKVLTPVHSLEVCIIN